MAETTPRRIKPYFVAGLALVMLVGIGASAWLWYCSVYDGSDALAQLHGKTETQAIARLGQPDSQDQWVLGDDFVGEFGIEVYNTYDPNDPATRGVVIRVLQWDKRDHHKTLFLHQVDGEWVVLESVWWRHGTVF